MDPALSEWLNLIARWVHVFAAILWVGQTYLFTKLDKWLTEADNLARNPAGQAWLVHSGGFYVVEKQTVPELLPGKLRWFRWEAALTWLSGMFLLIVVYYLGGILIDDSVAQIQVSTGVAIGVGVLVAGWVLYDLLWQSPLGKSELLGAAVCFLLLAAATFGLSRVLSGRAAYMHVGAMLGTIMTANVWMRILPAQRRMLAAIEEGKMPDAALAARAKLRSKHNTYMAVPVVFIMVSSHFPATYGNTYGWTILMALLLAGWAAAKLLRNA